MAPVHPRACGGAVRRSPRPSRDGGSSPRVRGSHEVGDLVHVGVGFIPARAGEPSACIAPPPRPTVHPRAGGGAARLFDASSTRTGSSPRVRGSPSWLLPSVISDGFIPARAGEPSSAPSTATALAVHPRACGGAAEGVGEVGALDGFIPARAGEPETPSTRPRCSAVHPRACGGAPVGVGDHVLLIGSSPRVRGSRRRDRVDRLGLRFIPARAGEPCGWSGEPPAAAVHPRACGGARGG